MALIWKYHKCSEKLWEYLSVFDTVGLNSLEAWQFSTFINCNPSNCGADDEHCARGVLFPMYSHNG